MKYTGTLQAEKDDAYFIFETDEKSDFEKVLVQVKLSQKQQINIMDILLLINLLKNV